MDKSAHHAVNGTMVAATTFKSILALEPSPERNTLLKESARVLDLRVHSCVRAFGGYEEIEALINFGEQHGKCDGCDDFRCYFADDAELLLDICNRYADQINVCLGRVSD